MFSGEILTRDYSAAVAYLAVGGVYHAELSGGNALYLAFRFKQVFVIIDAMECGIEKFGCMAVLECHLDVIYIVAPWLARYEMHLVQMYIVAVLLFSIVSVAYVNHVVAYVLFYDIPRAPAQT